jgi:integrase
MPNVQSKNGRYQARYRDAEGKQHSRSFTDYDAAWTWARACEADAIGEGTLELRPGEVTVRRFAEEWLDALEGEMGPHSLARMRRGFENQVFPSLGGMLLGELSALRIKAWRNDQMDYAASTRRLVASWLLRCLTAAVDDRHLDDEILAGITRQLKSKPIRRDHRPPVSALSTDEVIILANAMPAHVQVSVKIAAMTGLRISEVLGLTVDKVDFLRHEIHIHRQLKSLPHIGTYLGPTKTQSSYRTIPVEPIVTDAIAAHLARFPTFEQEVPVSTDDRRFSPQKVQLTVMTKTGRPYLASNFDHLIKARGREAGLGPGVTFHRLRHHYASLHLADGMPLPELAAYLGHANPAVTLRVYSHFMPQPDRPQRSTVATAWGYQDQRQDYKTPLTPLRSE